MEKIIGAVIGAVLIACAYYIAMDWMEKKEAWGLKRKGELLADWKVLGIGVLTLAAWIGIGMMGSLYQEPVEMCLSGILVWGLAALSISDIQEKKIPNRFLLLLILIWVVIVGLYIIYDTESGIALFFRSAAGGLISGLIFLLCYILSRRELGAGDVKLTAVMGLYLTGQRIMGAIFYGILFCFLYSIIQLCRKKLGLKDGVALVPFLYIGTVVALLLL
ncbi:MAG: A24 family peptidase [Lachnospiraceae bacterium]|nr:A24 family peptidase [Lachnospiraceae bacterium]